VVTQTSRRRLHDARHPSPSLGSQLGGPAHGHPIDHPDLLASGVTEPTDQRNPEPTLQDFFTGPRANAMRLSAKFNPGGR
jgi:hypothetical protein